MLSYNLLKYYLVLINGYKATIGSVAGLNEKYPNLKWNEFATTKEFRELKGEVDTDINTQEVKFESLYDQCEDYLEEINQINTKFNTAFNR